MLNELTRRAVIPRSMAGEPGKYKLSPGHIMGDLIFVSGQIGFEADGSLSTTPARQAAQALGRVAEVLHEAGSDFHDLVSVTSYHVGPFVEAEKWWRPIVESIMVEPFPAWVSVEVAGLAMPGAVIEVSAIASTRQRPGL